MGVIHSQMLVDSLLVMYCYEYMKKDKIKKNKWIDCGGNFILRDKKETFFISYNPNTSNTCGFGEVFAGDTKDETALVKEDQFYILNGDWREDYEKLIDKGFDECFKFYESKGEFKSSWSN